MRIIGFNFKKMLAERKSDLKGKLEVKTHMDIGSIEKENLDFAGDVLRFHYIYSIDYNSNNAVISFEGSILIKPDKEEQIKDVLKEWKKKKIQDDLRISIFNFVMNKCNFKALQLEDEFGLPPHIPLPRISKQDALQGKASYAG
jgi:hypothetical protein